MGLQTTRRQYHPQTNSPLRLVQLRGESILGSHSGSTPVLPAELAKPSQGPTPGMNAI